MLLTVAQPLGVKGGRVPPLTGKNLQKIGEKREKIRKNWKKEEESGRKGNNRECSFTLPLLTDRAGYTTSYLTMIIQLIIDL